MTSERIAAAITLITGLFFVLIGIWAFAAPASFYDHIATFPPYNKHFLHDAGAFQIGIGAVLLLAVRWRDAQLVTLAGAFSGSAVHAAAHVIDHDLGGKDSDAPLLAILALALLAGAVARWFALKGRAS